MLSSTGLTQSFGFGNHIGLATPGQIAAVRGTKFALLFAQQSVKENVPTGRTLQGDQGYTYLCNDPCNNGAVCQASYPLVYSSSIR